MLEYFDQEATRLQEDFLAKNANVLLVHEQCAKGKRKVKEAENARKELATKLAIAESKVKWLGARVKRRETLRWSSPRWKWR